MWDAGSAIVTLTGRVVREPFESYGKLVDVARQQKEHTIALGARTVLAGFDEFSAAVEDTKNLAKQAAGSIANAFDSLGANLNKAAMSASRDMGTIADSVVKASDSFDEMAGTVDDTSKVVIDRNEAMAASAAGLADTTKAAADSMVESAGKMDTASKGGGGGGLFGGGKPGSGDSPEEQAKKTSKAWKDGFNSLASMGKWVTVGVLGVGALSVKAAADFQKQMELVSTQAGYTQKSVDGLKKSVLDLAPAVGVSPAKLAEALFHIASSGIPASKAMQVLEISAKGARIGNADLTDTTNALVSTLKALHLPVSDATSVMSTMNQIVGKGNMTMTDLVGALTTGIVPAAKAVGLNLKDVGAALDVMTSRGIPAQEGANRLRTVLSLIANPTAKAKSALAELGFSQDRLAQDFRKGGLVEALQDLQTHMHSVFGEKLDTDQIRQALQAYATQLQDAGASTTTISKDLYQYKQQLDQTGSGAIKSSQLIAEAFGGARMGTTMQILMQNVSDVRSHFNALNTDNAAGQFQQDWQKTQKTFSQQVAEMWAGVQKLGIELGQYLIPKLEDLTKVLISAAHWLGQHKELADALAVVFGTVLTAAVVAFFTRFAIRTADGVKSIGSFGKAFLNLPGQIKTAADKISASLKGVKEDADAAGESVSGVGSGMGGEGGGVGGAEEDLGMGGMIEGLITGVKGTMAPGSMENPLAVIVMASEAFGLTQGSGTEYKTESELEGAEEEAASQSPTAAGTPAAQITDTELAEAGLSKNIVSPVVKGVGDVAPEAEAGLKDVAPEIEKAGGSLMTSLKSGLGSVIGGAGNVLSKAMGGAMIAGIGSMGAKIVGGLIGGTAGKDVSTIGSDAALGAGAGSIIGPEGTIAGGVLGAGYGAIKSFLGNGPGRTTREATDAAKSKGVSAGLKATGTSSSDFEKTLKDELDQFYSLTSKTVQGPSTYAGGRGAPSTSSTHTVHIAPDLDTEKGQQAAALAEKMGEQIGSQMVAGWQKYKFGDESTMFSQLEKTLKDPSLPEGAKASAANMAVAFAQSLEQNGDLVGGSANKLVQQVEAAFPGLTPYLGKTAKDATDNFVANVDTQKILTQATNLVNGISGTWQGLPPLLAGDGNSISSQWGTTLNYLVTQTGSQYKNVRTAALQSLQQMVADAQSELPNVPAIAQKASEATKETISSNLADAAAALLAKMGAMGKYTKSGMAEVTKLTKAELSLLGDSSLSIKTGNSTQAYRQSTTSNAVHVAGLAQGGELSSLISLLAGGGVIPGAEFGPTDQMTLVDPHGRPRAKMAGNEAVFTKHQMPFVNAGLQMLGFGGARDLWKKVNTPHYSSHALGGLLGVTHFATGGALSYAQLEGLWDQAGGPQDMAPLMAAIAEAESAGNPNAHNPSGASGLWQILGLPFSGNVYNPLANAKMAVAKYKSQGLGAWTTWTSGAYKRYLNGNVPADAYMGGSGDGFTPISIPKLVGTGDIVNVANDAVQSAVNAANTFLEGMLGTTSALGLGNVPDFPVSSGAVPVQVQRALESAQSLLGRPYVWGGYGFNAPGLDCSGLVSTVLTSAGLMDGHMTTSTLYDWGDPGPGKWITIGVRNPNSDGHTMMEIDGQYFESGGGGPYGKPSVHRDPGWDNAFQYYRHPPGFASGGYLPGMGDFGEVSPSTLLAQNYALSGTSAFQSYSQMYSATHPSAKTKAGTSSIPAHYGGGYLGVVPGFASGGGSPWGSLPSDTGDVPGYRPVRVRRGTSGLHTVGGKTGKGSSSASSSSSGSSTKTTAQSRPKQTLTQKVANTLDALGLGTFTSDQNQLGILQTQYQNESDMFSTFDEASGNGMPLQDLTALMDNLEQQWDILYKEWTILPSAIATIQSITAAATGHAAGTVKVTTGSVSTAVPILSMSNPNMGGTISTAKTKTVHIGATGYDGLLQDVDNTENEIASLTHQSQLDSQKQQTERHNISAAAMSLAQSYASQTATIISDQTAIAQQRLSLSAQKLAISRQISQLSSSSTSTSTLVSGVMSGTISPTTANPTTTLKSKLHLQVNTLQGQDQALAEQALALRTAAKKLSEQRQADALKLREQGFDAAWSTQLKRFKIQDMLYVLRQQLKALKASLASEKTTMTADSNALQTLENWQSGGLQGTEAIGDSLESVIYDILQLYEQGAPVPTSDKYGSGITLQLLESVLSGSPPSGLGYPLPEGLVAGQAAADQATTDWQTFQASRASLFSQFGGNFVPAGGGIGGNAGLAAGVAYFGAAAGSSSGAGTLIPAGMSGGGELTINDMRNTPGPGGTTINVNNHFASGPPNPHSWSAGTMHELNSMN